jgi:hypothetical protein
MFRRDLRFRITVQMKRMGTCRIGAIAATLFIAFGLQAQVNVTTYHNDNARTGQNTQETILTPSNVNSGRFGKLFTVVVDGWVYAQPLYLSNVSIGGGSHNVLYVATEHDTLYAIDADNGTVYWHVSLIPSGGSTVNSGVDLGCGDLVPEIGITGTPVIDTSTGTIYLVAKAKLNGSFVQNLHAIDVATSAEKFGGPVQIKASVPGTASDGNGTTVSFNSLFENQRPALLLENGHVVIGWSSHCDFTPWHGWIISYKASTLAQEAAFNASADGSANGVWMSGGGLAADSAGNIFFATGNGTWNGTTDYGDSIVKLGPPSGGKFSVSDYFTPYNQSSLAGGDTDLASGGLVLLPDLPSGQQLLTQMGKEGKMYLVDRNNMGKYCVNQNPPCSGSNPNIVQEIAGATSGVWGTPAYWNGSVYWGGGSDGGGADKLKVFSFNANSSGLISTSPTSESAKAFSFAAPSPSISANGSTNGIVWGLDNSAFRSTCSGSSNCQVLYAYDATNLANMLYNSSQAANSRDVPGGAVKFATPIIANGKVYVGSQFAISAYGTSGSTPPTAAMPTFSPAPGSYSSAQVVMLSDTTPGAVIHCTKNGTTPTASSPVCTTFTVSATTTVEAIAVAPGFNNSMVASGVYTIASATTAATPTFTPAPGSYSTAQSVMLSDTTGGAVIHCTTDKTTPTASSPACTTLTVSATTTIKAIAVATGFKNSAIVTGIYTITSGKAATPTFSPAPGSYSTAQSVTLSDNTAGAVIHCTTNGTAPTATSPVCTTLTVSATTTVKAIAVAVGLKNSVVATGKYTVTSGNPNVNYGAGFSSTGLARNGAAVLSGTRLRLTDGGGSEAGSGFYGTPLNIQAFTTDFSFQLTNPNADGMAFVIQNSGSTALGPSGGGLGYGPDTSGGIGGIPSSLAVKFDLYDNAGEGTNSTGLYTNGASPTTPATTLGGNVNLHSGDVFNVHITYDGTTLTMTITDASTPADTFTTSWAVNIPGTVGSSTAFAGFTGGTGGETATQDLLTWTFTSGASGSSGNSIVYEATTIPAAGSPNARSFTWSGFPDGAGEIADGTGPGAYLNFTVNVATPGTYDIKAGTKKISARGIFQLSVNGANVGPTEDEYDVDDNGVFQEYDLGLATFPTAGNYSFKFTVTGQNPNSSGFTICFDYIKLTAQ